MNKIGPVARLTHFQSLTGGNKRDCCWLGLENLLTILIKKRQKGRRVIHCKM